MGRFASHSLLICVLCMCALGCLRVKNFDLSQHGSDGVADAASGSHDSGAGDGKIKEDPVPNDGLPQVLDAAACSRSDSSVWDSTNGYHVCMQKHVLYVTNSNSAECTRIKNYYVSRRPGAGQVNVLSLGITVVDESMSELEFNAQVRDPVIQWMQHNSEKKIHYIIFGYGIPSRTNSGVKNGTQFLMSQAHLNRGLRSGNLYVNSDLPYTAGMFTATTALVTHMHMGSVEATKSYIDKLRSVALSMNQRDVVLSANNAGMGGMRYAFDDAGRAYPSSTPGALAENAVMAVRTSESNSEVMYSESIHLQYVSDVTGYLTWGFSGGQGSMYAVDQQVNFSGRSSWYLIASIESFNGRRASSTGNFAQWFSENAFGGRQYQNTPVGAVTHVEEPHLNGVNSPLYFSSWEKGRLFIDAAWGSRKTPYFMAVGDPLVRR